MKTNPRLAALAQEFADNKAGLDYLDELAGTAGRDLTAEERTAYEGACTRMEQISTEITEANARSLKFDAVAAVTATIDTPTHTRTENVEDRGIVTYNPADAQRPYRAAVAVETMGAELKTRAKVGLDIANGRITRDAGDEVLGRALAHGVAADGTAPVTIEGDLINFVDANRYAVNAARALPMPDNHAPTFKRPRLTQHTTVDTQVTEGDVLSSQRLQNTGDTVTKLTNGGVLALSEQEIDWTDPAMLGLAIQDLAEQYAISSDTVLTAAISASAALGTFANKTILSLTAASDALVPAIASAAATVYGNAKKLADTLFVSVDRWAFLAGLVDADGRPLFPTLSGSAFNAAGSNGLGVASFTGFSIMGLKVVVDPNFASNTWIVAVSQLCEFYEQNKGLLSINVPSTLEVQYAYRGYVAANVYTQGLSPFRAS